MTVTIYRSSDASAPGLTGQAGSLIGVLDACLVNGYGAKAAAGWAKEFSGTNLAVYRAPSGNRLRIRVNDTGTTVARVVGYETMTDVDTGVNPFPTAAQVSGGLYVRKSETADSTVIVGSGRHRHCFLCTAVHQRVGLDSRSSGGTYERTNVLWRDSV